ncbi:hypothetical protein D9Q98_007411 [Chlorella vulgaris]|uniref:Uncharacterized protein n=1 Tax=Chlorella vulgaris TaxID=3077 RepID=A0A9D4TL80_CHLVU|nr:hypothetical protein D9Q98_007411 [Chlorella vulgaris]
MASASSCCSCQTSRRSCQAQWQAQATSRAPWSVPAAAVPQRRHRGAALVAHVGDATVLQELIVGGAVTAATAAALINGSNKGEPEVCSSCAGTGGITCIVCEGSGKMSGVSREALAASSRQRDPLGGSRNQRECVACKGPGKIFCKQCKGSGFSRRL